MRGVAELLGTPFETMKCWQLVREVYKANGRALPDYPDIVIKGDKAYMEGQEPLRRINEPVEGCICAYALHSNEIDHVGVYLGGNKLFHSKMGTGACIEKFSRYLPRLKGMYI